MTSIVNFVPYYSGVLRCSHVIAKFPTLCRCVHFFHEMQASTKEKTTTRNNPHVFMYIQNKSTTPQLMIPVLSINPFLHFYIARWRRRLWKQKMCRQLNTLWCEYAYFRHLKKIRACLCFTEQLLKNSCEKTNLNFVFSRLKNAFEN